MIKNEVISKCPVCSNSLLITRLNCNHCKIEINGEFSLSKLNYLSREQLDFVLIFLKNQGSIKAIEKEMNLSYPTVKKLLNEVLIALGFDGFEESGEDKVLFQRNDILERLSKKEISFEEAKALLNGLKKGEPK